MKISQVAKQAGVGIETIRFYERKELLAQPPRTYGEFCEYSKEAVAKIRFIKRVKDLGLPYRRLPNSREQQATVYLLPLYKKKGLTAK